MLRNTVENVVAGDILTLKAQLTGPYQVKVGSVGDVKRVSGGFISRRIVITHWRYAPTDEWSEIPPVVGTLTITSAESVTIENPELF